MQEPFSIIIPTFNRQEYLKQAIESAIALDYDNYEIIVSDNASTDKTNILVKSYQNNPKFKYFRKKKNIGMVRNWKSTLALSTSPWFIILSDDDYFVDRNYLKRANDLIRNTTENLKLIYSEGQLIDDNLNVSMYLNLPFSGVIDGSIVFKSRGTVKPQDFTLCNVIFNREVAIFSDAFSNPNNLSCDSELFLTSCLEGKVGILKGPSTVYRFHSNNLLKTTQYNTDLLIGSLDSLINPYIKAINQGLINEADTFRKNTRLDYQVSTTLIKTLIENKSRFLTLENELRQKAPSVLEKIDRDVMYSLAKNLTPVVAFFYKLHVKLRSRL